MLQSDPVGFTVIPMNAEMAELIAKDVDPLFIKWAKDWLGDLAGDAQEQEDIDDFLDNATDGMIVRRVDILWDGGWVDFERTAHADKKAGCK